MGTAAKIIVGVVIGTTVGGAVNGVQGALIGALVGVLSIVALVIQLRWIVSRRSGSTDPIHAVALAVGVLALLVMGEIGDLLTFMRSAGAPVRDIGFLTRETDTHLLLEAMAEFKKFDEVADGTRDATWVAWFFIVVDSVVFVWAYGMVLARIIQRRVERIGPDEATPRLVNARWFVRIAAVVLVGLIVVDWVENLSLGALMEELWNRDSGRGVTTFLAWVSTLAFLTKWGLTAAIVGLLIAERISTRDPWFGQGDGSIREVVRRTRPLVVTLVALAVLLFQPLQVRDVLLRLGDGPQQIGLALLAAGWLALTVWAWARHLIFSRPQMNEMRLGDRGLILTGLGLFLAAIGLMWLWHFDAIALYPGALLIVIGGSGLLLGNGLAVRMSGVEAYQRLERSDFVPVVLGACVPIVIGAAMLRAGVADTVFIKGSTAARSVVIAGVALVAAGIGAMWAGRKRRRSREGEPAQSVTPIAGVTAVGSVILCGLALWGVLAEPVGTGQSIGALALLLVFLAALASVSGWLTRQADQLRPPTLFRQFSLKRIPLFAMVGLWLVIGQVMLDPADHDITPDIDLARTAIGGCEGQPPVSPTIDQAWDWWLRTNSLNTSRGDQPKMGYPVVIIAASGGGIRAAWWTAGAMSRLIPEPGEPCPTQEDDGGWDGRQVFAASGISGGSLGLAAHQAALLDGLDVSEVGWVDDHLGLDHLSPPLAWFTYVELARSMIGFPSDVDRAEIMERSWEEPWSGQGLGRGLRSTWLTAPQLPLLALNGTSVADGCRVFVSVLDVAADAADCHDTDDIATPTTASAGPGLAETYSFDALICGDRDLSLSTAALLSARFPLISPPGRVEGCAGSGMVEAVDGGYRDANGAETAVDLWNLIQPMVERHNADPDAAHCLVPVFVQIDDDFRLPAPSLATGSWPELLAPLEAVLAARGTQSNAADYQVRSEIDRRISIAPTAEPGAHPSLGWSLSETTRTKMADQLIEQSDHGAIQALRDVVSEIRGTECDG